MGCSNTNQDPNQRVNPSNPSNQNNQNNSNNTNNNQNNNNIKYEFEDDNDINHPEPEFQKEKFEF